MLLLAGCGGQPEPTADEIAKRAITALDALQSAHFVLGIEGGPAYLDATKTLNLRQAEGDLLRPDRAQVTARVAIAVVVVNVKFITVGPRSFMTDPLSGTWGPAPPGLGYDATALFHPENGVAAIIRKAQGLTKGGDETLDGVATYHLSGTVPAEALRVLTGGALPGETVALDLWIDKEGSALRRVRMSEPGKPNTGLSWTLTLSRHNQTVAIEAPI